MDTISATVFSESDIAADVLDQFNQITFQMYDTPSIAAEIIQSDSTIVAQVNESAVIVPQVISGSSVISPEVILPSQIQGIVTGTSGPRGNTGPAAPIYSYSVPAVSSFTISHMLGRRPVGVIFYDVFGNECDVGILNPDLNTLDVIQENLTEGVVTFL